VGYHEHGAREKKQEGVLRPRTVGAGYPPFVYSGGSQKEREEKRESCTPPEVGKDSTYSL